ncbi:recombinase family protein [Pseudonocardia adelaidensis]|uniref:Recombinase family protein n=1 Tax=Pseudonocardia adelaidensis TaxID=648754 RepID=A0ABP9PA10_9PSEU
MRSVNHAPDVRRAVLYGRVSKLPRSAKAREKLLASGDVKSVDQQLAELTRIARREGVEIVSVRRDDGISASRYAASKQREGWRDVMATILDARVTELWVWEISRATRDRPVWAALINACIAHGVLIVINGKVHDPNDPDDGFMLDLGAALAVRESALTSKRIRRDVAARAAQGLPHGKIPYGYRRVYDPLTRALIRQEPDPETSPIVQELARRVLAGESMYALTNELNARGVPSPETVRMRRLGDTDSTWSWRQDQVRDVIISPAAAGKRVHQGKVLEGVAAAWPPIISPQDHALLVQKLRDPARRSWVDASVKHLLVGLAHCGVCGSPLRRTINRKRYGNYSCMGGKGTFCVSRKQEWLDTYVTDVIIERLSQPDALEVFTANDGDDVQAAQRELAALRAELAELRHAKKAGRISLSAFLEFEPDLLAKIDDAQQRSAAAAGVPPLLADTAGPDVRERWAALTMPQQREVVRALCTVYVHRTRQGTRSFDPSSVTINWHSAERLDPPELSQHVGARPPRSSTAACATASS